MKYGVVNSLQSPRFAGIKTFMRMQNLRDLKDVDFAVVGIPFDTCATYRGGARFGPASVREMSSLAAKPYNPELEVDIFDLCSGVDYGDIGSVPGYIEESFEIIKNEMKDFFSNKIIPIAIGGDHSVTLPELRACSEVYGPEDSKNSSDLGYESVTASVMHHMSEEEIIQKIYDRTKGRKVFLTFDIDFLDPAFAPGTGTPVPGGFSTWETLQLIRGLKDLDIVGYDIVEVAPAFDPSGITSIAAAGLIQEFMSMIAWRKKHGRLKNP